MYMRRLVALLLFFLTFSSLLVPCVAHSGGTDENGGHYDRSTGEYHYHHGKPAHQHPNGECPYESKKPSVASSDKEDRAPVWLVFVVIAVFGVYIYLRLF